MGCLRCGESVLFSSSESSVFRLFFTVTIRRSRGGRSVSRVGGHLLGVISIVAGLSMCSGGRVTRTRRLYRGCSFAGRSRNHVGVVHRSYVTRVVRCTKCNDSVVESFRDVIRRCQRLPSVVSASGRTERLHERVAGIFCSVCAGTFVESIRRLIGPSPVVVVFFGFKFVSTRILKRAGAGTLCGLASSLKLFRSTGICAICS